MRSLLPALTLVATLALAGCSDGDASESARTDATPTASPTASATDDPTDESTDESTDAPAPEGVVATARIRFEAPDGWVVVATEDLLAGGGEDALGSSTEAQDYADQLGISVEQLTQLVGQSEVMALTETAESNLNVITAPGAMPDDVEELRTELEAQYASIGAELGQIRATESAAGEVIVADYVLEMSGVARSSYTVFVPHGAATSVVTIGSPDPAVAKRALDRTLDTLELVG